MGRSRNVNQSQLKVLRGKETVRFHISGTPSNDAHATSDGCSNNVAFLLEPAPGSPLLRQMVCFLVALHLRKVETM